MRDELQQELEAAIRSDKPLEEIVAMLRSYKAKGVSQGEVYSLLEDMRDAVADETLQDRILEVADFVAGFCSPHMKIWDG
jgi:hypothetical protein